MILRRITENLLNTCLKYFRDDNRHLVFPTALNGNAQPTRVGLVNPHAPFAIRQSIRNACDFLKLT